MQARRSSSLDHCSRELALAMIGTLFQRRSPYPPSNRGVKVGVASSKGWDCRSAPSRCLTCNQGHLDSRSVLCTAGSLKTADPPPDTLARLRCQSRSCLSCHPWNHPSHCHPIPSRQRRPGCRRRQARRLCRRCHRRIHPRGFRRCRRRQLPCRQLPCRQLPCRRCRRFHHPNHRRRYHRGPTSPRFRPCPPCLRLAWRPMWTDHPSKAPRR
jgi:hypothetical protein